MAGGWGWLIDCWSIGCWSIDPIDACQYPVIAAEKQAVALAYCTPLGVNHNAPQRKLACPVWLRPCPPDSQGGGA
jgi:hypothetical protein